MKRCLSALAITLLWTSVARTDQSLWDNFTSLIVGEWQGNGQILANVEDDSLSRGQKFTLRASYYPAAAGNVIQGTQVLRTVDHPERSLDCTVSFGWNPVGKTIEVHSYWADGFVEHISLREQKGDDFQGRYTIFLPTGQSNSADILLKTSGADKFAWTFVSGPNAGTTLVTNERIPSCSEPERYLTFWKGYFQGEWNTTVLEGEESGVNQTGAKGIWICKMHPSNTSMIFTGGDPEDFTYGALAGYDPRSRAWKEVFFAADGNHLVQYYQASADELDPHAVGQVIKGWSEYTHGDGRIELADIGVRVISRDRCEYYVVNRRIGGRSETDLLWVFERRNR